MTRTFQQLQAEIAALTVEAHAVREKEIRDVVGRIKQAISFYGLTAADLGLSGASRGAPKAADKAPTAPASGRAAGRPGSAGSKVAVKYRDKAGNTWTGRGSQPRWLKAAVAGGAKLDDFKV